LFVRTPEDRPEGLVLKRSDSQPAETLANEPLLLEQIRRGDMEAYGTVVEHYRERLYYAALRLVRNHDDARDLSQDAFVRAWQRIDQYDPRRPFYPWLYRIAHNLCLDYLRRAGTARQRSLDQLVEEKNVQFRESGLPRDSPPQDVRERIHSDQMAGHLRNAIDDLKPEFREIIIMKHLEHMSYKEIAETLEIPEGTVMSRLYHARKHLAKLMEPHRD
jgi:RNA polymerase sigma-70 factor (ECF subfamily)